MKRILVFIGLKIKEISEGMAVFFTACIMIFYVVGAPFFIFLHCASGDRFAVSVFPKISPNWTVPLAFPGTIVFGFIVVVASIEIIGDLRLWFKNNWIKAGKIAAKPEIVS